MRHGPKPVRHGAKRGFVFCRAFLSFGPFLVESTELFAQLIMKWHEVLVHAMFDKFVVCCVRRCAGTNIVDTLFTIKKIVNSDSRLIHVW